VESLHYLRGRQMFLEELGSRGGLAVELRNVTVTFRVVVVRVNHDLAREGLNGHRGIVLQRDCDHDHISGLCRLGNGPRPRLGPSSATSFESVSGPRELLITTL